MPVGTVVDVGEVGALAAQTGLLEVDAFEKLLACAGLEPTRELPPRVNPFTPDEATRVLALLLRKPVTLGNFPPRMAAAYLLREVLESGEVSREKLLRRVERFGGVAVLRPDGYLAWVRSGSTQEEDFLRKSPSEVALYLLATRSALARALVVGRTARPTVDYTPVRDKTQEEEDDDEVREVAVGMLPGVGELLDFSALVTGYNVAGHRQLTGNERLLCAVGVLLPIVSGKALGVGGEAVQRVALATGRSADEVRAMVRVAQQVAPEDAARLERISRTAARTGRLAEEDWDFLQRTARHLDSVLAEFHAALKRGEKVPFLALRTGADGLRLVPGSPEHMAQAWMEYQFRHPRKYPSFRYAPDEQWRRMYRTILENKAQGSEFEQAILQKLGHEKNTALLMPPPGSKAQGFIPDAVPGNPNPGELVWGQPYRFVESKAHKDLALTGNLKAMLEYVAEHGGHLELWVRSARHSGGPTRLTKPLRDRLAELGESGKARVRHHP